VLIVGAAVGVFVLLNNNASANTTARTATAVVGDVTASVSASGTVDAATTITRPTTVDVSALTPGELVVVQGATNPDGTVTATQVTANNGAGGGFGGFGGGGRGGGGGAVPTTAPATTTGG
jgi:hypothetical protein